MVSGVYYVQDDLAFPAILIKTITGSIVMVHVFTDQGQITTEANEAASTDKGTFVRD